MKLILSGGFFLLIFAVCFNAQTAIEMRDSVKFERQAAADHKAKDYAKFLENIKLASDLRPGHVRLLYNLADVYALNNKPNEALIVLECGNGTVFCGRKR